MQNQNTKYQPDKSVGCPSALSEQSLSKRLAARNGFKSARTCAEGREVDRKKCPCLITPYFEISVETEYREVGHSERKRIPAICLPTESFLRHEVRQEHHHRCIGTCRTGTGDEVRTESPGNAAHEHSHPAYTDGSSPV